MIQYPRITIVTPSFNDAAYLETTIRSIVEQRYPNLEYIVMDGGSTDGSVEIIKKYSAFITYWQSGSDDGMYDAIQQGFEKSTGEIMGWINSDDKHHNGSLFIIAQIFSDFKKVQWVQGTQNAIDETGKVIYVQQNHDVDRFFFYRKQHIKSRYYIQQESTFWRRSLWEKSGGMISKEFRYAGDFELWIRFFKYEKLYTVPALLGSFRISRSGQASVDHYQDYANETLEILKRHPLSNKELASITAIIRQEKLDRYYRKFKRLFFKNKIEPSVIHNEFYFDMASQGYKMFPKKPVLPL